MPSTITKKSNILLIAYTLLEKYSNRAKNDFWQILETEILLQKIRFPLLEFFTEILLEKIPFEEQIDFSDRVVEMNCMGSYVIAGIVLKNRLSKDLEESFEKAVEYFIQGDEWYVCDIIGERVLGTGLLDYFEKTMPFLIKYAEHENHWVKRSVGTATHLATKWGLEKEKVRILLDLSLIYANTPFYQMKKGIGWGVKTIAKVHPDLIFERDILDNEKIGKWFLRKVKIGLANPKTQPPKRSS